MMYSIPVGQHGLVANNRKYFPEINSTSIFKCPECAHLPPPGTWKFGFLSNACLKFHLKKLSITPHSSSRGVGVPCWILSILPPTQQDKSRPLTFLLAISATNFYLFFSHFAIIHFSLSPNLGSYFIS